MIQCKDCELFHRSEGGQIAFRCDPFTNVREPECLVKWQLIKLNQMVAAYQSTLEYYHKLAPMQEKMFKVMEREIDELNESDKWRIVEDEGEEEKEKEKEDEDRESGGEEWRQ